MVITRTPFRISFFGGGTDYPVWYREHGGAVLSTSIDKYCYITCRYLPPYFDCKFRIRYREMEETQRIAEIKHPAVRETLAHLKYEQGVEMQHNADVPGRSGLGSSSSFTVGFLNALYALRGEQVDKHTLARDAIHIEQNRINENVGSQDQVVAAYGGLNKIVFGGSKEIEIFPVEVKPERLHNLQKNLMLFFLGFQRNASDIAAEQIKNTPQKQKELFEIHSLVDEGIACLTNQKRNLEDFGKLLNESWMIKRGLSSQITSPAIDHIYATACKAGATGGKLLGAGTGGFMLLFVPETHHAKVREALQKFIHVPFQFESAGSSVIYTLPQDV